MHREHWCYCRVPPGAVRDHRGDRSTGWVVVDAMKGPVAAVESVGERVMNRRDDLPISDQPDFCCLVPDRAARASYDRAAAALAPLQNLLGGISYATVAGPESRDEPLQAAKLLEEVAAILTSVSALEAPRYHLLERPAPRQILGGR